MWRLLVAVLLISNFSKADVPNQNPPGFYAVTCLMNLSGRPFHYSARWGKNRPWKDFTIDFKMRHWWNFSTPDANDAPALEVKFDGDMGPSTRMEHYTLDSYSVPTNDCSQAANYTFQYADRQRRSIDLYESAFTINIYVNR